MASHQYTNLAACQNTRKVYYDVIEDTIENMRQPLLDDGMDMTSIDRLKEVWLENLIREDVFAPYVPAGSEATSQSTAQVDGPSDADEGEEAAENEDEDDDDDDDDDEEGSFHTANSLLCFYDRVSKTKGAYKCALRNAVLTVDRKSYVFSKIQAELKW
ncbi:uncharacterized protein MONBRDRAFT_31531 [Monosiga brevicollis MX1]|uniref:Uncharacterized protein n=1 Tax=Monosiga brevicollis TaxID=81824 RepID=A9UTS8_MONBE|nr:uncharacterized protein MONBRDRAFT_31531 [Monosiga brevicollis MX1]EDQ91545.1 predicted protein [Monosiga brevicollis MX1]|eukprot:XP_001743967.1 hypothetical protein [Monosiga brevicollis MX1]